ncbi:DUF6612 family protein [Thalassobacillus hwangdonensis]|uniref:DUF6612 family protein n=1 Tax=Thalassobacillus hwangdonensis TaxID=546108 RepID=A0ABW3L4X3_9BACI
MKKWTFTTFMLLALIALSACSKTESEEAGELFQKAVKASEKLESFHMEATMDQEITMEGMEDFPGMNTTTSLSSDIQVEPSAFHQTMEMMGQKIEMYYTEEALYLNESMNGETKWYKAPEKLLEDLNQMGNMQQNPSEQMELLKEYSEDFSLENKEDSYILTFDAEGEKVNKLVQAIMKENLPEGQFNEEMFEGLTTNQLSFNYTIDKEKYYPEKLDMELEIELEENGERTTINQKINAVYSKFNQVKNIKVPDEVMEQAEELPGLGHE